MSSLHSDAGASDLSKFLTASTIYAVLLFSLYRTGILSPDLSEHGPIELLSAASYLVCMALFVILGGLQQSLRFWYIPALFFGMFLRELDINNHPGWTYGLTKSRQFVGPGVPWGEWFLSLVIIGCLVFVVTLLIKRHWLSFWMGLKARQWVPLCVAGAILCLAVSQNLDGLGRRLAPWGVELQDGTIIALQVMEELLELSIPVFLAAAVVLAFRTPRQEPAMKSGNQAS